MDNILDEINIMLKGKNIANRIDGLRKSNGKWEWALETCYGDLEWFDIHQACIPVEEYLRSLDQLGAYKWKTER